MEGGRRIYIPRGCVALTLRSGLVSVGDSIWIRTFIDKGLLTALCCAVLPWALLHGICKYIRHRICKYILHGICK